MKHPITLLLVFGTCLTGFSQANTVSAGGDASGSGGTSSYSIGQIDYISSMSSTGKMDQGNQQPYELYLLNLTDEDQNHFTLTIGPNPTFDKLNLSLQGDVQEDLYFEIVDVEGRILHAKIKLLKEQTIRMDHIASGNYFLTVYKNTDIVKSYQLIKTN